jgi:hypothetical protein
MRDGLQKFPELSSMFWRGTCNNLQRATAPSMLLGLGSTIQRAVSLRFSFFCTTFQLHPSIFCQKNYLKISLQFLAGDMQLLGRSYLC